MTRLPGAGEPLLLVPIGRLDQWTAVRGATNLASHSSYARRRIVFSHVTGPHTNDSARRWLDLQRLFQDPYLSAHSPEAAVLPTVRPAIQHAHSSGPADHLVFWRLAVGKAWICMGASALASIEEAQAVVSDLRARAAELEVCHAFSERRTQPLWAALDDGEPVLVGAPDSKLAVTYDPAISVASALKAARVDDRALRFGGVPEQGSDDSAES